MKNKLNDEDKKAYIKEYQKQWRLKNRLTLNAYFRDYMPSYYKKRQENMTDEERQEQRDKWKQYQRSHRLKNKENI